MGMAFHLGLDSSTQSLSAILIDMDTRKIVLDLSVNFDADLPQYGTQNGVLPNDNPAIAHSDPLLWLDALDLVLGQMADRGIPLAKVEAIAGSGQQHGSVYLKPKATEILRKLNPRRSLAQQLKPALSRPTAPIWMDSSTRKECDAIEAAVGGAAEVANLTGSSCFERFTGPQIRKFAETEKRRYAATGKIHLVSSFMASVLAGKHAAIDHGDGAGMNLMDINSLSWSTPMLKATAAGLRSKLPRLARSDSIVGRISPYFVDKYGFSPKCRIVAWSGDNPNSLIGVGLIAPGKVCISLGTSDTYFGAMPAPKVSTEGEGHVFGSPTGDYMSLICFLNGSLAREEVKDAFGLSWEAFSKALKKTKPGNGGKVMLPYFSPEITPNVAEPGVQRYGLRDNDVKGNVRAVVEAQMASMALHSEWMGVKTSTIYATGGASANREILQVMADVQNADVYQFEVGNSAGLGAALRAAHADLKASKKEAPWEDIVKGFAEPVKASRVKPNKAAAKVYREFLKLYAACESHALAGGPDPKDAIKAFKSKLRK